VVTGVRLGDAVHASWPLKCGRRVNRRVDISSLRSPLGSAAGLPGVTGSEKDIREVIEGEIHGKQVHGRGFEATVARKPNGLRRVP
jgi:hypothetical protein